LGSFGSMDSNSLSYKSYDAGGLTDVVSDLEQPGRTLKDKASPITRSSVSESSGNLDLFAPPVSEPELSAVSSFDLFRIPAASSAPSLDLFQPSVISSASSVNLYQPSQTSTSSSLDFFAEISLQQPATTLDEEAAQLSVPENEGWATFDTPLATPASIPLAENPTPERVPSSDVGSLEKFDLFSSLNTSMHWPSFQSDSFHGSSSTMSNPWHDVHNVQPCTTATSTQVSIIFPLKCFSSV
jgi:Arf-GAP domain and FG repeat-containing protein 1